MPVLETGRGQSPLRALKLVAVEPLAGRHGASGAEACFKGEVTRSERVTGETSEVETSEEDGLIRAAVQGDRSAFGELYLRYARMVHSILLARVPAGDAEDLVQDVFIAAMRQLHGLRTAAAFRGWLGAIARNRAIDYFRQARQTVPLDEKTGREHAPRETSQDAFLVLDMIRGLPEAYRETLIMRLVEGMTGPEIARLTGLTPDSVRVNLCRGMKMLRELAADVEGVRVNPVRVNPGCREGK